METTNMTKVLASENAVSALEDMVRNLIQNIDDFAKNSAEGDPPWQILLPTAISIIYALNAPSAVLFQQELLHTAADFTTLAANAGQLYEVMKNESSSI